MNHKRNTKGQLRKLYARGFLRCFICGKHRHNYKRHVITEHANDVHE